MKLEKEILALIPQCEMLSRDNLSILKTLKYEIDGKKVKSGCFALSYYGLFFFRFTLGKLFYDKYIPIFHLTAIYQRDESSFIVETKKGEVLLESDCTGKMIELINSTFAKMSPGKRLRLVDVRGTLQSSEFNSYGVEQYKAKCYQHGIKHTPPEFIQDFENTFRHSVTFPESLVLSDDWKAFMYPFKSEKDLVRVEFSSFMEDKVTDAINYLVGKNEHVQTLALSKYNKIDLQFSFDTVISMEFKEMRFDDSEAIEKMLKSYRGSLVSLKLINCRFKSELLVAISTAKCCSKLTYIHLDSRFSCIKPSIDVLKLAPNLSLKNFDFTDYQFGELDDTYSLKLDKCRFTAGVLYSLLDEVSKVANPISLSIPTVQLCDFDEFFEYPLPYLTNLIEFDWTDNPYSLPFVDTSMLYYITESHRKYLTDCSVTSEPIDYEVRNAAYLDPNFDPTDLQRIAYVYKENCVCPWPARDNIKHQMKGGSPSDMIKLEKETGFRMQQIAMYDSVLTKFELSFDLKFGMGKIPKPRTYENSAYSKYVRGMREKREKFRKHQSTLIKTQSKSRIESDIMAEDYELESQLPQEVFRNKELMKSYCGLSDEQISKCEAVTSYFNSKIIENSEPLISVPRISSPALFYASMNLL